MKYAIMYAGIAAVTTFVSTLMITHIRGMEKEEKGKRIK